ncbi:acyltransferase family protein [Dokdonella immobilis]|uniref:Peptidoglycan/LPS O-acetylase OafA/YrhL, contains acyltransferase and SGNH-hydrolase domains n=1 Tax=Dokdonella immobilis TaxID=578942 RepID=A0A1I4ZD66_9GAMM|nr:acyltransferase family protein [Dokdonella immobilis]SFN47840.1 Peptidoglycan/LPS O-acetylase OafA/YrhL, contains acyltransferase and SGNH-hydrolase domains [Dokdonella immobilis]
MAKLEYRPDIDGLRGIAVLAVVAYHFELGPLHGGFVGVDIFFVISGFLITGIIRRDLDNNSFSFGGFYERRVRRIFPALFAMLATSLVVGFVSLLPSDLDKLGTSALATLAFSSNVVFWQQSGYFANSAALNPMLHTWSLGVEEQFYIVFPVLLLALHMHAGARLNLALAGAALTSFVACVAMQSNMSSAVFFLSPFRAWELLAGAVVATAGIPQSKNRILCEALAWSGLVALVWSLVKIYPGSSFPGWHAAVPVAGTALLLHSGMTGNASVNRLLRFPPLVFVGLISYSLYLWHWPVLFYWKYRQGFVPLEDARWSALLLALLISYVSYRYVESPFRKNEAANAYLRRRTLLRAAAGLMIALGIVAAALRLDGGMKFRLSDSVNALDAMRDPPIPYVSCRGELPSDQGSACILGDASANKTVAVWGDSTALAWAPAFNEVLSHRGLGGVLLFESACPPLLGVQNPEFPRCLEFNNSVLAWLEENNVDELILVAIWPSYSMPTGRYSLTNTSGQMGNTKVFPGSFARTVGELKNWVGRITIVGPTPGAPPDIPLRMALALQQGGALPAGLDALAFGRDASYFWDEINSLGRDPRVRIIDPAPWFCDHKLCRYLDAQDNLLYRDTGHLSLAGAAYVAVKFGAQFDTDPAAPAGGPKATNEHSGARLLNRFQ